MKVTYNVIAVERVGDEKVGSIIKILNDWEDAIEYAELWVSYQESCYRLVDYDTVFITSSDKTDIFNVR